MKKLAVLPVLVILLLTSSCQFITGATPSPKPEPAPAPAPTPIPRPGPALAPSLEPGKKINANRVRVKNGEFVEFSGITILPDGTYLQTQLYVGDEPEPWWPADKHIQVQDKKWQITVPLGENGAPKYLSMSTYYSFKVWQKDNPAVMAGSGFDLMGPPPDPNDYPMNFPKELKAQMPDGNPVIIMRILYTMRGERSFLGIYEDGFVVYVEETGMRPTMQTIKIWKVGRVSGEELNNLFDFLRSSNFMELDKHYSLSTIPHTDLDLKILAYYQDINKFITAQGYSSPDGGKTIPNMPYPLNEIYKRLRDIAINRTVEVARETIKD